MGWRERTLFTEDMGARDGRHLSDVERNNGTADRSQAEATGRRQDRHHYRMADHSDRPVDEGGFRGLKLRMGRPRLSDDLKAIEDRKSVV